MDISFASRDCEESAESDRITAPLQKGSKFFRPKHWHDHGLHFIKIWQRIYWIRQTCNFAERIKMDSLEALTCSWTYNFFKRLQRICWIRGWLQAGLVQLWQKGSKLFRLKHGHDHGHHFIKRWWRIWCYSFAYTFDSEPPPFRKGWLHHQWHKLQAKCISYNPTRGGPCSCLINSRIFLLYIFFKGKLLLNCADRWWTQGLESWDHHHHNLEGCGRKGFVLLLYQVNCSENTFHWCHIISPKRASASLSVCLSVCSFLHIMSSHHVRCYFHTQTLLLSCSLGDTRHKSI